MDKSFIVDRYFQKSHILTPTNREYAQTLTTLFTWLTQNDHIQSDQTTIYMHLKGSSTASIVAHEDGVLAGMEDLQFLLEKQTPLTLVAKKKDGEKIKRGDVVARLEGDIADILSLERTILNFLQRLSGIATQTNRLILLLKSASSIKVNVKLLPSNLEPQGRASSIYHQASKSHFHPPLIAATRKTPWMQIDKKAVSIGGGLTHRLSLADGVLIKDNHLDALYHLGGDLARTPRENYERSAINKALMLILTKVKDTLIEVEVTDRYGAFEALEVFKQSGKGNYLAIMLDNFVPSKAKTTLAVLKKRYDLSRVVIEASGGIGEDNVVEWAQTGVDILSLGSLTHSARALDLSLSLRD